MSKVRRRKRGRRGGSGVSLYPSVSITPSVEINVLRRRVEEERMEGRRGETEGLLIYQRNTACVFRLNVHINLSCQRQAGGALTFSHTTPTDGFTAIHTDTATATAPRHPASMPGSLYAPVQASAYPASTPQPKSLVPALAPSLVSSLAVHLQPQPQPQPSNPTAPDQASAQIIAPALVSRTSTSPASAQPQPSLSPSLSLSPSPSLPVQGCYHVPLL